MWFGFLSVVFVFFVIIFIIKFPQYAKYHFTGTDSDKVVEEYDTRLQVEMFGSSLIINWKFKNLNRHFNY